MKTFAKKYLFTAMLAIAALVSFLLSDKQVIGGLQWPEFLRYVFFGLVGQYILIQIDANYRDPRSQSSPYDFSWRYLFWDNINRIVNVVFYIFIAVRFLPDLWPGAKLNDFTAMLAGIGGGLDAINILAKNWKKIISRKQ